MTGIHRERWFRLGPVELGVSIPVATDRRLARSRFVRAVRRSRRSDRRAVVSQAPNAAEPLDARRPETSDIDPASFPLIDRVARLDWYHSMDLGHGVTSPGRVDYRGQAASLLPESLTGKRCLDAMTTDGFWAFEMEKRDAAEVVAVDVARASERDMPAQVRSQILEAGADYPTGDAFALACEALGSRVIRREISVYRLAPEVLGKFDFMFAGDVLLGLRDPQLALDSLHSICAGTLHVLDTYHTGLESFGETCLAEYPMWSTDSRVWWYPSANTIRQMLRTGGFGSVTEVARFMADMPGASDGSPRRARVLMRASV